MKDSFVLSILVSFNWIFIRKDNQFPLRYSIRMYFGLFPIYFSIFRFQMRSLFSFSVLNTNISENTFKNIMRKIYIQISFDFYINWLWIDSNEINNISNISRSIEFRSSRILQYIAIIVFWIWFDNPFYYIFGDFQIHWNILNFSTLLVQNRYFCVFIKYKFFTIM